MSQELIYHKLPNVFDVNILFAFHLTVILTDI